MDTRAHWILSLAFVVAIPASALAQDEPEPEPEPDDTGEPTDFGDGDGGGFGDGSAPGAEENPDAPPASPFGDKPQATAAKTVATPGKQDYPIEEVLRPITLPRFMAEVTLDYPAHSFSPLQAGSLLMGTFGITRNMQAGVLYGVGTVTEDGYEVGKAAALDFTYLITNWVGAQIQIPILFDPFALGVTLAAPMKFIFLDKLALLLGEELITFKVAKFAPVIENAAATKTLADLDSTGTELNDAELRVGMRVQYQYTTKVAFEGRFRVASFFPDNDTTKSSPFLLTAGAFYSTSNKLDFGGRIGFSDMADFDTFGLSVFASLRI